MACVAEYKFGLATVRIYDDYIEKDPVKHQELVDKAFEFVENVMIRHALEEERKQNLAENNIKMKGEGEVDGKGNIKVKRREGMYSGKEEAFFGRINA